MNEYKKPIFKRLNKIKPLHENKKFIESEKKYSKEHPDSNFSFEPLGILSHHNREDM